MTLDLEWSLNYDTKLHTIKIQYIGFIKIQKKFEHQKTLS